MKVWQCYLLIAAILAGPHMHPAFAFGAALAWMLAGLWAASKGD